VTEAIRDDDEPEYAAYSYTDSSVFNISIRPNNEHNTYDHSEQGIYNILSLRNRSSSVNEYDEECFEASCSAIVSNTPRPEVEELNVVIEPECFINLFHEDEKVVYSKWETETHSQPETKNIARPKSSMW
jgi:hypothetical protein